MLTCWVCGAYLPRREIVIRRESKGRPERILCLPCAAGHPAERGAWLSPHDLGKVVAYRQSQKEEEST